jgi:plasmid stabilization system protein ParE
LSGDLIVSFTPRAMREVAEAKHWWRANRAKAPDALEEELRTALGVIASTPHIGAIARDVGLAGVRRLFLNRVNYFLYYRLNLDSRRAEVVALWHARRGSGPRLA